MAQKFSKLYENEFTLSVLDNPTEFKNIVTPSFSPFPDNNITFCFEAWYLRVSDSDLFKLKLVKLSSACTSPTLEVFVKVHYSDGCLFEEYKNLTLNNEMKDFTFNNVVQHLVKNGYCTSHYEKMISKTLIIKCKMTFDDQDLTLSTKEMKSIRYADLLKNLKSVYELTIFCDFIFKIGDKNFPAHKVILAAHSSVFRNMMTHEFLESKTSSVTITDTTPEIFELFLRYLYSGELEDKSWNSLKELYYLADKYDVGFLKIDCTEAAISILSVDLVCEILKLAYRYSDSDLKTAAINFAVNHIKEIVPREDWKELVSTHLIIGYEVIVNFIPK